jgi:hypothetical protein
VLDDPIREQPLRVDTAGACGALAVPDVLVVVAERAVELADVADLRSPGSVRGCAWCR